MAPSAPGGVPSAATPVAAAAAAAQESKKENTAAAAQLREQVVRSVLSSGVLNSVKVRSLA